jgi:hypothetical protein
MHILIHLVVSCRLFSWHRFFSPVVLILFFLLNSCQEDPVIVPDDDIQFAVETGDSEIPYVVIETHGIGILNEPKVAATMIIYQEKLEVKRVQIGIEYRGSTSFRLSDKKSYGIETWDSGGNDIDETFFGFPAEEDFILLGQVANMEELYIWDRTMMFNYVGYNLYREMGQYASRTKYVEVELNGEYLGVYVFMEKLKRDSERINISKLEPTDIDPELITGGYILKIDKTSGGDLNLNQPLEYFESNWADDARYTEAISFRSQYDINGKLMEFDPFGEPYHSNQYLETYFLYEYPKSENITEAQKTYIQTFIHDFETALLTDDFTTDERSYTDYINMASFVDHFILNELVRNVDGYRLSTYLYKDRSEKLKMGPVWDLNIAYNNGGRIPMDDWVINYNDHVQQDAWMMPFWWPRLMKDPLFRNALKTRWSGLRLSTLSNAELLYLVDQTSAYLENNGAVDRNYNKWDQGIGVNYSSSVEDLKSFLEARAQWMDEVISAL